VPVEVVGLAGLLSIAEVAQLISMLRLVADPTAGAAAMEVLTGPRWRLGARDLAALWRRAVLLEGKRPAELSARQIVAAAADTDTAALAVALADPGPAEAYSAEGYRRIIALGSEQVRLSGYLATSYNKGDPSAVSELQTDARHYFQRPDAMNASQLAVAIGISKGRVSQLRDSTDWPPELALAVDLGRGECAAIFEAIERRVDRPGARPPAAVTARLEFGDDLVAVHRSLVEQGEDGERDRAASGSVPAAATPANCTGTASTSVSKRRRKAWAGYNSV
jgi:hypothetical protein